MSKNILEKILKPSRRGKIWQIFFAILLLAVFGGLISGGNYYNRGVDYISNATGVNLPKTKERPFRLGLDLQGGTHLVYEADMSAIDAHDHDSAIEGVRDVIERRVNVFGVSEPSIQTIKTTDGDYRVAVELAGVKDVNEAIKMIGETPLLEFKERSPEARDLTNEEKQTLEEYNTKAQQKAENVLGKLISGGDFDALAREYSEDEKSKNQGGDLGWVTGMDYPDIVEIAATLKVGESTKTLINLYDGYEFIKLEDKRTKVNPLTEKPEKEVKASHLLICYEGLSGCESGLSQEEAYEKIKQIKDEAVPESFDSLVRQYSDEPGAQESGGDLGWFGSGIMVAPFEDTVFDQEVNTISWIVETQFGYHLIYKQDERDVVEYKIRRIFIDTMSAEDITGPQEEWKNTELTGKNLKRASIQQSNIDNSLQVSLEFDSEGSKMFEEITARNVGQPVAIFLDGYPISAPTVNEKISGGKAVITGSFNIQEARLLAQRLNAGALPVPIELISQKTVGASLGHQSITESLDAGILGVILVMIFMILVYRLAGALAAVSLFIYGILVLALFKLFFVTLTLAGMAGFILSIGMAVDANVLIFERIKEELRKNKPLNLAIEEGFRRAWPSIRDGNFSTLITCLILFFFTTSVVKGFAITLMLGILVSMFSAIVITKNLLMLVSGNWLQKRTWFFGVKKKEEN